MALFPSVLLSVFYIDFFRVRMEDVLVGLRLDDEDEEGG